jgi:hypothetical protein
MNTEEDEFKRIEAEALRRAAQDDDDTQGYVRGHYTAEQMLAWGKACAAAEPPQREWQGLTNEDWEQIHDRKGTALDTFTQGAVWAESQLRERNT